jgi:hypothetical protein
MPTKWVERISLTLAMPCLSCLFGRGAFGPPNERQICKTGWWHLSEVCNVHSGKRLMCWVCSWSNSDMIVFMLQRKINLISYRSSKMSFRWQTGSNKCWWGAETQLVDPRTGEILQPIRIRLPLKRSLVTSSSLAQNVAQIYSLGWKRKWKSSFVVSPSIKEFYCHA